MGKNFYDKNNAGHPVYDNNAQEIKLKKDGASFFNFNSLTYCGPYFRDNGSKQNRHSSVNGVESKKK